MAGPRRTCVGCRRRCEKDELLRFRVGDSGRELALDLRQRAPGRGVYICPEVSCVAVAVKRRAFARGLRRPVDVPEARALLAMVVEQLDRELEHARRVRDVGAGERVDKRRQMRVRALEEKLGRLKP